MKHSVMPAYFIVCMFILVAGSIAGMGKKVDVDAIPQIGGQSLLDFDLEEAAAERPWRLPGVIYIEMCYVLH